MKPKKTGEQEIEEPKTKARKVKKAAASEEMSESPTIEDSSSESKGSKKKVKNGEKTVENEDSDKVTNKKAKTKDTEPGLLKKMTDADRLNAIGLLEGGMTQLEVAAHYGVAPSSISRLHRLYAETGSVERKKRVGSPGKKKMNGQNELQADANENLMSPLKKSKVRSTSETEPGNADIDDHEMICEEETESDDNHELVIPQAHNPESNVITWPEKDMMQLINRIEALIPDKDSLAFTTRTEKLDWEEIAFEDYSAEECKNTWLIIQKKQRKFRLMKEVLSDAREWIAKPWSDFSRGGKNKRHPDFPKRPLSTYMMYYMKKKDKIMQENPGIDVMELSKIIARNYKTLPAKKLEKYSKAVALAKEEYDKQVEEFYQKYPQLRPQKDKKAVEHKVVDNGPKKPNTPFGLFYLNQLESVANQDADKTVLKEKCKEMWKNLSDKKKVIWINWADKEAAQYQEDLKNYITQNPTYVPVQHVKSVLTKEERSIQERMAGKPVKPPSSAYSYFSQHMLQSEEVKQVNPRDRMNVIATIWKKIDAEEKKMYKEKVLHMMEQYKLDFASYLESLPEDKRQEELLNINPKRKKVVESEEHTLKKRKSDSKTDNGVPETSTVKEESSEDDIFKREPKQPPKTVFEYFLTKHTRFQNDKKAGKQNWENLTKPTQRKYEKELDKLKHTYLVEFEGFLKQMSKVQLKKYRDLKLDEDAERASESEEEELKEEPEEQNDNNEAGSDENDD